MIKTYVIGRTELYFPEEQIEEFKKTLLGRVTDTKIVPLNYKRSKPYVVSPRNVGQYFVQEALIRPANTGVLLSADPMHSLMMTLVFCLEMKKRNYSDRGIEFYPWPV